MSQQRGCTHEFKDDDCLVHCGIGVTDFESGKSLSKQILDGTITLDALSHSQKDRLIILLASQYRDLKQQNIKQGKLFCVENI